MSPRLGWPGFRRLMRLRPRNVAAARAEMQDEIVAHVALAAEALIQRGVLPDVAWTAARARFGDYDAAVQTLVASAERRERLMRKREWFAEARYDLRFAWRALRRARVMAAIAVATLAIGIAAVSTVFSFVNTAMFRPVPYANANQLVAVGEQNDRFFQFNEVSLPTLEAVRHDVHAFSRVAAYAGDEALLSAGTAGIPASVSVTRVDSSLFPLLGVAPQLGRVFTAEEVRSDAPVVVISDKLWRDQFGGGPTVVGSIVQLGSERRTIIGVMPNGFRFPEFADAWLPLREHTGTGTGRRADAEYSLIARLRLGVSRAAARREIAALGVRLRQADPAYFAPVSLVMRDGIVQRDNARVALLAGSFLLAALCVLLVACVNVGNLFLARGAERRPELAVRAALGASRGRLVRQGLTESLIVGVVAGSIGTAMTFWLVKLLVRAVLMRAPAWVQFGVDWRVLVFTIVLSLGVVVAFGLGPALTATRFDLTQALKVGGHGATNLAVTARGRRGVVIEIAASVVLLVFATLAAATYRRAAAVDPGYDADNVLVMTLNLARSPSDSDAAPYRSLIEQLARDPRVAAAAFDGRFDLPAGQAADSVRRTPLHGRPYFARDDDLYLWNDVSHRLGAGMWRAIEHTAISDEYFQTLHIPRLAGRSFMSTDTRTAPLVGVASQALARLIAGGDGRAAVGAVIRMGTRGRPITIVGVVGDRHEVMGTDLGMTELALAELYMSERQVAVRLPSYEVLLRARRDAAPLERTMALAAARPPGTQSFDVRRLAGRDAGNAMAAGVTGLALGGLAATALVLAMLGTYGVIAYGIAQRTREIGVRIALGGTASQVRNRLMRDGLRFTLLGLAIGLALALAGARVAPFFLWQDTRFAPSSYLIVVALFTLVALSACYLATRRVLRVDPLVALRSE